MTSFTETSQLLQKELVNDYSYAVGGIPGVNNGAQQYDFNNMQQGNQQHQYGAGGIPGINDSQYDFNHVQQQPPPSAYMQRTAQQGAAGRMSAMPGSRGGVGRNTETARPM